MDLLANTRFDFMKYRRYYVPVSGLLVVASLVLLVTGTLNLGVDFAGGTQLVLRFKEQPEVDVLRRLMEEEGFEDPPLIQRFGADGANEVLIKTRLEDTADEGSRSRVVGALQRHFDSGATGLDVNQQGAAALTSFLMERDPDLQRGLDDDGRSRYETAAAAVMEVRRQNGLIESWDQLAGLEALSAEALATMRDEARLGSFTVLSAENVGPQIGSELRTKGVLAVVFSLIGMLAYIWARFELRFGIGALAALVHDVLIALGFYVTLGYEFNLTTIAAFLTLVGYSVNDSVVVFDRVRENLRRSRRESFVDVINKSLNQTLSRTLLTSGTTILALGTMFFFGGEVLRGFSFVLLIGVVVGTYSSICVASPTVLFWERLRGRRR